MNITITFDFSKFNINKFDVMVNDEQTLYECLDIVNESLKLGMQLENINYCRSKRKAKIISVYGSFKENDIYTGDLLEIL